MEDLKGYLVCHLGPLHQHVLARNSDMIELDPTVIDAISPHFGSAVPDIHTGHGTAILQRSELYNEAMQTHVFSFVKRRAN